MPTPAHTSDRASDDSLIALIARLFWMILGPIGLILLAMVILRHGAFSLRDGVFAIALLGAMFARYVDVSRYHGKTAEGAPATMKDVRSYMRGLLLLAVAVWGGAHVAGQVILD